MVLFARVPRTAELSFESDRQVGEWGEWRVRGGGGLPGRNRVGGVCVCVEKHMPIENHVYRHICIYTYTYRNII